MDPKSIKFTWRIDNFTGINSKENYSEVFTVGGYKWRILMFSKGNNKRNNVDHLSLYLDVADSTSLAYGWSRYAQFSLCMVNQIHGKYSIQKDTQHQFNALESDWGFTSFMPLSDLYNTSRGYLVNDTVIVEAEVVVGMPESEVVVVGMPESVPSHGMQLKKDASKSDSRIGDNDIKDTVPEPKITARNLYNQDEVDDKDIGICFDEMATALLEKLEDNKACNNSVRISDFKEIASDNYVDVGIFKVPASLESYAKDLLARHADIGAGNSPVHYVNEMVFVVLCGALKSMVTTCFSEITESLILKWRDAISGAMQFGFKVDFLKGHLKSVVQTYLVRLARNSRESRELQATDDKITAMEKELDALKVHRSEMHRKTHSELRKNCEAVAAKFPGETYGSLFH